MPDDAVDPRFDPRFQRGYDPRRHGTAPLRPPRHEAPPPVIPAPVVPAARQPPTLEPNPAPPPTIKPQVEVAPGDPAPEAPESPAGDDFEAPPRRNVPLLALLVVGIASMLMALALVAAELHAQTAFTSSQPELSEMFWQYARAMAPQPLFAGGVAAVVAWLITRALVGRER